MNRDTIIAELVENMEAMIEKIEEQGLNDPDFKTALEVAEQLRDEVIALQE